MTDYKKIAEALMEMPADRRVMCKKDFEHIMKTRKLQFKQNIDTFNGGEVWGNNHFELIVLHKSKAFQIL